MSTIGPWIASPFTLQHPERVHETLCQSLFRVVQHDPHAIALIDDKRTYTFLELSQRIAGMAEQIHSLDKSHEPIALVQGLHINAIVAWFACALANKPFLLLDPQHPKARLSELMQKAQCRLVLADEETKSIFTDSPDITIILPKEGLSDFNPNTGLSSEAMAMLFPTSGSSGEPKLIAYATMTLQAKVQASIQLMHVEPQQRVLIAGSHAQYGYLHHALVFLLAGGTLCLSNIKQTGFQGIVNAIEQWGVRHIRFTPSLFRKLVKWTDAHSALKKLDAVRFSGEPLLASDLSLATSVLKSDVLIQNVYGSTESALFIWSNTDASLTVENSNIPIGFIYPLASFAIRHDTDKDDTEGELLIKTSYQALGDFYNGQIQTSRWYESDAALHERIYATGDLVRLLPNGSLLHLGRKGRMVKVRGNRVYLNEVEHALRSIDGIVEACVIDSPNKEGSVLYAFVTTNKKQCSSTAMLNELSLLLPDYMLPRQIRVLPEIPLLVGGKVNYTALLAEIKPLMLGKEIYESTEEHGINRLISLWDSLLFEGAHQQHGDFISLGGDSIQLIFLLSEIERIFKQTIPTDDFRYKPSFSRLAHFLNLDISSIQFTYTYELQLPHLISSAKGISKGIALSMTGFHGVTQARVFTNASLFLNYDVWGFGYPFEEGNILDHERWWQMANEIAFLIRSGKIPAPKIVFGYSVGGSVAWLVSRLLADSPYCPEFLIMVDASPLHRLTYLPVDHVLAHLNQIPPIYRSKTLHVLSATLNANAQAKRIQQLWQEADGIDDRIVLPTIEHAELARAELLLLAQEAITDFLHHRLDATHWRPSKNPPKLPGVLLYNMLQGDVIAWHDYQTRNPFPTDSWSITIAEEVCWAFCANNDKASAKTVLRYTALRYPNSKKIQYLQRRLQRNASWYMTYHIPKPFPKSIAQLENRLASSFSNTPQTRFAIFKFILMWMDMLHVWRSAKNS